MKKILLSLTFIAAMLTSCVSDYGELNYAGKDAIDVVIGVGASELAQSRAAQSAAQSDMNSGLGAIDNFSEDEWAKYDIRYMLEVYDVTENYVNLDTPVRKREVQTYDSYQETKFELRLIPNRTYKFVVWADFVEQGSKKDLNYNTTNLKSITRIGDVEPMDESMDAYFVQENIEIVNSLPKKLVLKRPFGKLRVITTDIEDVNFGTTPSKVDVTFYNHPTFVSLNALTGNAETTVKTVTYSYSIAKDAPYTAGYDADSKCQTIFADYILAQSSSMGSQEVNFTLAVTDQANRPIRSHTFDTQIPLERNKLTTLYGNLLTTATEFNISVDDDFDGEYNINADAEQLAQPVVAASVEGNVVTLSWDAVENADYYAILYGDNTTTTTSTSAKFTLDYETEYTFEVQACSNNTMTYLPSDVAAVTVKTEVLVVKLEAPKVTYAVEEYKNVVLSWDAVENADFYTVSYDNTTEKVEATTVTFTLAYETKYTFAVQAYSNDTIHYLASDVASIEVETQAEPAQDSPEYIYLKPNSNWLVDNARFAVYTWVDGGATEWYDMVDSNGDGIYEVEKSNLKSKIIFCRMNPSATANDWNNKWNQTNDLTLPTDGNNLYTVAAGSWDNGNGTWSVYVEEEEVVGGNSDFATLSTSSSYGAQKTTNGWVGKNCAVMAGGTSDSNPVFKSMMGSDGSVKGMTMNGKTTAVGTITSPTISTGCGILKFKYGYPFSESNGIKFKVEIMQNGVVVNTYTVENKSATKLKAYEYETNVNVSGDFQIIFTNLSPSNSSSNKDRYTIWDVEWTGCK